MDSWNYDDSWSWPGPWLASTFAPATLGPWLPMLSGTTFDSNRSGFILTMYLVLLDRFAAKSRYATVLRFTIGILVLSAFSRSGTLCWLAYYLFSKTFWTRLASRRARAWLAAIAIVSSIVCVAYQGEIVDLAEAWDVSDAFATKMSMEPGSSGESHILLIQRGFEIWLTSTKTIIVGIGYAAAPKVLEDFFGMDNKRETFTAYTSLLSPKWDSPPFSFYCFFSFIQSLVEMVLYLAS